MKHQKYDIFLSNKTTAYTKFFNTLKKKKKKRFSNESPKLYQI